MSIKRRRTVPVVIQSRTQTGTDAYNNPVFGWPDGETVPGIVQQTDATEVTVDRDTQVTDWLLTFFRDVTLTGRDRVKQDGRKFEVVGAPNRLTGPRGVRQVEARLRHLDG